MKKPGIQTEQTSISNRILTLLALVFCAYSSASSAQGFGTLFTEPEEREYMDFLRDDFVRTSQLATFNIDEDVIPDIPDEVIIEEEGPQIISYKFGGLMVRINGNRMVWLNNQQVAETDLPGNISVIDSPSGYLLNIRANGTTYSLKAGQSIDINNGEVLEPFEEQPGSTDSLPVAEQTLAEAETTVDNSDQDSTAVNSQLTEAQGQTDLGNILNQLNPAGEVSGEDQGQRALDLLTEQINQTE